MIYREKSSVEAASETIGKRLHLPVQLLIVLILIALAIKVQVGFFSLFIDPLAQIDTCSYLKPALDLIFTGKCIFDVPHPPAYPYLIFLVLIFFHNFTALLVIQKFFLIFTAICAGLIYRKIFEGSIFQSLFIVCSTLLIPRAVIYSHTLMSDNFYSLLFILCVFVFFLASMKSSILFWILLAIFTWSTTLVRVAGITLVISFSLGILIYLKGRKRWIILAVYLFSTMSCQIIWSHSYYGRDISRGTANMSSYLFFGSIASRVSLEDIKDPKLKNILLPLYENNPEKIKKIGWVSYDSDGIVSTIRKSELFRNKFNQTINNLILNALYHHPFLILSDQLKLMVRFILYASRRPTYLIPKNISYESGIYMLYQCMSSHPASLNFANFSKSVPEAFFKKSRAETLYPYENKGIFHPLMWIYSTMGNWLPLVSVLFGFSFLIEPKTRKPAAFVLLVIFPQILIANLGSPGDVDGRYAIPIEPLYLILCLNGAQQVMGKILPELFHLGRSQPIHSR